MITLTNRHKNGNFTYTDDDLEVTGYFDADENGTIISLNLTYEIGTASVYHNIDTDALNYNINSSDITDMVTIAESIQKIYDEIQASLIDDEDAE
jgi:hypothetical protein